MECGIDIETMPFYPVREGVYTFYKKGKKNSHDLLLTVEVLLNFI